jgi:hypothetical protein
MASAGHMLQTQKANLVTQLKKTINSDLKELCRIYGKAVSGNKAELQKRCIEGKCDLFRMTSRIARTIIVPTACMRERS